MTSQDSVCVVLPSYNEEETLEWTVRTTLDTLESIPDLPEFELIVAEDGCDDETPEIAAELAREIPDVRHLHSDARLGRGDALRAAFEDAEASTVAYIDTDLSTDMSHLGELVRSVHDDGYDFATGSRWMPGSVARRSTTRKTLSWTYNRLVRGALDSRIRDHQCGFKSFDRGALMDVLDDVEANHWFWDTEVLVRAQQKGYRVKEFPVRWVPEGNTSVNIPRDALQMGSQVARLWRESLP